MNDMMKNALKGYNVSILAYGQTNSGKTFTINGGKDQRGQWQPGIVHLTASELFNMLEFMKSPEGIEQEMREKADSSFHSQGTSGGKAVMHHRVQMPLDQIAAEQSEPAGGFGSPKSSDGVASECFIKRKITISVSYMEIYNEKVNDLLDREKRDLDVRDHHGEVIVENLSKRIVHSTDEVIEQIRLGEQVRMIAETKMNSKSTRSHTVFRINVQIDDRNV